MQKRSSRAPRMPNIKGFTLIEIIIVLVILGVLAAIALPALFQHMRKVKAMEAFASMKSIKENFVNCLRAHQNNENECFDSTATCSTLTLGEFSGTRCWQRVVMPEGSQFNYYIMNYVMGVDGDEFRMINIAPQSWTIIASINPLPTPDAIFINGLATGQTTCGGVGEWRGIC